MPLYEIRKGLVVNTDQIISIDLFDGGFSEDEQKKNPPVCVIKTTGLKTGEASAYSEKSPCSVSETIRLFGDEAIYAWNLLLDKEVVNNE